MGLIIKLDQPKNKAEEEDLAEVQEKEAILMETEEQLQQEIAAIDDGDSLKEEDLEGDTTIEATSEEVGESSESPLKGEATKTV